MITQIALLPIFGYPVIMYGGIFTFVFMVFASFIGWRTMKGKCKLKNPIKWHKAMAMIAVLLGLIHGLFGLALIIGF